MGNLFKVDSVELPLTWKIPHGFGTLCSSGSESLDLCLDFYHGAGSRPNKGDDHMLLCKGSVFYGAALSLLLISAQAEAHWCDDLWASSYNIVVRPASDTVTVPASGTATMTVYVQNNMGYLLPNFVLTAKIGSTVVTATRQTQKTPGTLLPGEKATYNLAVAKAGGGSVSIQDISFLVSFGNSGESNCYPTKGANAVMVKTAAGTLIPATTPPPGLDNPANPGCGGDLAQGRSLQYSAIADFENEASGLDKLLQLYCAGRASWNTGSDAVVPTNCSSTTATTCPTKTPTSGSGTKYDYMHLWTAGELAARKSGLGARAAVFRARLQCGVNDADLGFAGFALFMLGYMGEDATARTFIESKVTAGGDLGTIAKAALYVIGAAADKTQYKAALQAGLTGGNFFAKMACAAALGIADHDDATVSSVLIPGAKWTEPDTSDDGQGLYASHLLALVAWDRRSWAVNAGDTGPVSFYGDTSTPPGGSGGATGSGGTSGTGGAQASGGATSTSNKDAGNGADAKPLGGVQSSGGGGGRGGSTSVGGAMAGSGGSVASIGGGEVGGAAVEGGATSAGGMKGTAGTIGASGGSTGGVSGTVGDAGPSQAGDASLGCKCNLGTRSTSAPMSYVLAFVGMAWFVGRRRRR